MLGLELFELLARIAVQLLLFFYISDQYNCEVTFKYLTKKNPHGLFAIVSIQINKHQPIRVVTLNTQTVETP